MYQISAILACADPSFCDTLISLSSDDTIPVKLAAQATSPEDLTQKVSRYLPDLMICDWELSMTEATTTPEAFWGQIQKICGCKYIFVSDKPDFDQLYRIIRFHASNFILIPSAREDIAAAVNETARQILNQKGFLADEYNAASRYLFVKRDINLLHSAPKTLEQVNRDYGMHFAPGLYRALIIKMDCSKDIMSVFENDVLRDKIIQIIRNHLTEFCYDILYDKLADGVMILFNYAQIYHDKIQSEYHQIFTEVKQAFQTFEGVIITMCISHEYDHYLKLPEAKSEVLDIRWARKHAGTDKILSADVISSTREPSVFAQSELQKLKEQTLHAFQILDLKESHSCMVKFFSCLRRTYNVISNRDARLLIRSMIDSLFDMHWGILTTCGDVEAMRHEFIYKTNMAQSMERLQHDFIQAAEEILATVSEAVRQHYSRPVLTAINYIQKNIRSPLSLNEIADLVGLTSPYFSSIFKKETGQTFSDYTAACRLDIAKKMLRESDSTISEIADHLGYSDSKYFTKMFRKKEQISPSEYRRISRAEEKIE